MPRMTPTIYLIGGCNGAGKTTFAREFLPKEVDCLRFMNADEIARGLSPFEPNAAAMKAGRVLLSEVTDAIGQHHTFGWESTLAGHAQAAALQRALRAGFTIELHYLFVPSVEVCLERIRERVRLGGHDVPPRDVARRFSRSLINLVNVYLPLAHRWTVWDAGGPQPRAILDSPAATIQEARHILRVRLKAIKLPPPIKRSELSEHALRAQRAFDRVARALAKARRTRAKRAA